MMIDRDEMYRRTQRFFGDSIEAIEAESAPEAPTAQAVIEFAARQNYASIGESLSADEIALFKQCAEELTSSYYRGGIILSPATETPIKLHFAD